MPNIVLKWRERVTKKSRYCGGPEWLDGDQFRMNTYKPRDDMWRFFRFVRCQLKYFIFVTFLSTLREGQRSIFSLHEIDEILQISPYFHAVFSLVFFLLQIAFCCCTRLAKFDKVSGAEWKRCAHKEHAGTLSHGTNTLLTDTNDKWKGVRGARFHVRHS